MLEAAKKAGEMRVDIAACMRAEVFMEQLTFKDFTLVAAT